MLNCKADWKNQFTLNENCLRSFAKLCKSFLFIRVVLSSTWRTDSSDIVENALRRYGITVYDKTVVSNKTRQEEIEFYIRRHDVEKYIILDDDESLFGDPERINLYVTNYITGLTDKDVKIIQKRYC